VIWVQIADEGMAFTTRVQAGHRPAYTSAFRILVWCFGVVLFVFALVPVLHCLHGDSIKDYILWYETGQQVLHGGEVYPNQWHKFPFMYPPPCALFLASVSALGKTGLVVSLVLVNAAAWICTIIFSVQLATGERRRVHLYLYLIPSFVVGVYEKRRGRESNPRIVNCFVVT
jgi:hypothetical protein